MFAILWLMCLYIVAMMFLNQAPALNKVPVIDDKKIEEHNSNTYQWKQAPNSFFEGATLADAKKLMNTVFSNTQNLQRCQTDDSLSIPDNFNVKEKWNNCVLPVADMTKNCWWSYAFTLSHTLAERNSITNNKEKAVSLSA